MPVIIWHAFFSQLHIHWRRIKKPDHAVNVSDTVVPPPLVFRQFLVTVPPATLTRYVPATTGGDAAGTAGSSRSVITAQRR
jgi:hypothetical protein